jgi:hypothetical protein
MIVDGMVWWILLLLFVVSTEDRLTLWLCTRVSIVRDLCCWVRRRHENSEWEIYTLYKVFFFNAFCAHYHYHHTIQQSTSHLKTSHSRRCSQSCFMEEREKEEKRIELSKEYKTCFLCQIKISRVSLFLWLFWRELDELFFYFLTCCCCCWLLSLSIVDECWMEKWKNSLRTRGEDGTKKDKKSHYNQLIHNKSTCAFTLYY